MKELNSRLHSRFASVKPYSLRSCSRLAVDVMLRGVGSYPRREKAERVARERADTQPGLDRAYRVAVQHAAERPSCSLRQLSYYSTNELARSA